VTYVVGNNAVISLLTFVEYLISWYGVLLGHWMTTAQLFRKSVFFLLVEYRIVLATKHTLSILLIWYVYSIVFPISNTYSNICNCRIIVGEKPHFTACIMVIYSLLTPDDNTWVFLGSLYIITVSELFTCVLLSLTFENVPKCARKFIFSR